MAVRNSETVKLASAWIWTVVRDQVVVTWLNGRCVMWSQSTRKFKNS